MVVHVSPPHRSPGTLPDEKVSMNISPINNVERTAESAKRVDLTKPHS
jgi:hypothetical protein